MYKFRARIMVYKPVVTEPHIIIEVLGTQLVYPQKAYGDDSINKSNGMYFTCVPMVKGKAN
jgi:hypothetical protein